MNYEAKLVKRACIAHNEHPTGYVHTYDPSTDLYDVHKDHNVVIDTQETKAQRNRSGWSGYGRSNVLATIVQCVFTAEEVMVYPTYHTQTAWSVGYGR